MKQKLFHLSKRKELPWYAAWGIRGAAILLALVVCGFVTTAMTGENPFAIYQTMWAGAFGTSRRIWNTLQQRLPWVSSYSFRKLKRGCCTTQQPLKSNSNDCQSANSGVER